MTAAALRRAAVAWCSIILPARVALAQDSVRVVRTSAAIRLDGLPDEAAWRTADSITAFTQTDPHEGQPASERTVVRLLATPEGLYVALWAYDADPGAIRHAQLRRDADLESDDQFAILLDAQHDLRSGYLFAVNPNGVLRDSEILSWDDDNIDWNGVWDARARITSFGWTAEIRIPWQTLRYRRGATTWGANFARAIRRKNELVLWHAWRRTEGILFQPGEGTLTGLDSLPGRAGPELRPYAAASDRLPDRAFAPDGTDSTTSAAVATIKPGLDVKLAPAPTVTADLTVNTDFAQVEADRQVLNLTRFPLFFPEQRPFFLEASGNFDFGQIERTAVFTSRRIGLAADGSPVPIVAGARLSGRIGSERLGLLAVRTGGSERAGDFVARVRHDVFTRGYVGAIATVQTAPGVAGARAAGGIDASVPLVVQGQNLVFGAWWAASRDSSGAAASTAWRLTADFPNDFNDDFIGVSRIQPGYDPALGFVVEADVFRANGHVDFFPRPRNFLNVRRLHFNVVEWDISRHADGAADHSMVGFTPLGADFESGDEFEVTFARNEDAPRAPFEIFPGDTVAAGHYWWNRAELTFSSSAGRSLGLDLTASVGDFYTGTSTAVATSVVLRAAPHVIAGVDLETERVRLATASFTARAGRLRLDVAATPRLGGTLFVQGDNESDRLTLNGRLHWIPSPGSDVYIVYNSSWPTGLAGGVPWVRPEHGALIGKVVWYFRL